MPPKRVNPAIASDRTREQTRLGLKKKVRMFYDLQRMRLQCGGRIQPKAEGNEIQLHEVDQVILENRAKELLIAEKAALRDVQDHLKTMLFYTEILSDKSRFKGLGPTMAGVILSEFDIAREDTASQMWAFAGLAPVPAQRCKKCNHLVEPVKDGEGFKHAVKKEAHCGVDVLQRSAIYDSGKSMRPKRGEKLPYNAFLKTKLVGVLGPCLIKANSPWRKLYDDYKHRKASAGWGTGDAHRHHAAIRYMVKQLLLAIWKDWRAFEDLPVRPSYQEEKLGHTHEATAVGSNGKSSADVEALMDSPEVEEELANAL